MRRSAPRSSAILDVKLRIVECFAPYEDAYDVLIDDFEQGLRSEDVTRVFDALQPELTALVEEHAGEVDGFLRGPFDVAAQDRLSREAITAFGVDWSSFRLDLTVHPFEITLGQGDIRLTTRYDEGDLNALFTAMHESGHGLYEFGSSPSLDRTPMAGGGASMVLHESQSRLWENVVGRSLPFWRWFYPRTQAAFPEALGGVSLEDFHRAINRPVRSFVRVDADETSYGLHVILRYELERELVAGTIAVADLPDAWNTRFEELLGLEVPNDALGVLQDSHWSSGYFGYFPTYLLGSVLSVQIWERAAAAIPDVEEKIERGDFAELHGVAAREPVRARQQVPAPGDDRARRRRPGRAGAVPRVPARQARRAVRCVVLRPRRGRSASRRGRAPARPRPRGPSARRA